MTNLRIATSLAVWAAAAGLADVPTISASTFTNAPPRQGRKPSGAAAAKRAAKRRRNIAKRPRTAHKYGGNAWTRAGRSSR